MERELKIKTSMLSDREFINIKDLRESLGTSQNTIYRMCDRKELNKYKFRGRCFFRTSEICDYLTHKGILKSSSLS